MGFAPGFNVSSRCPCAGGDHRLSLGQEGHLGRWPISATTRAVPEEPAVCGCGVSLRGCASVTVWQEAVNQRENSIGLSQGEEFVHCVCAEAPLLRDCTESLVVWRCLGFQSPAVQPTKGSRAFYGSSF